MLRYSSTKTCRILLRFSIVARSRFSSLSSNVCHTEGNGVGIRWRIWTPMGTWKIKEIKFQFFDGICRNQCEISTASLQCELHIPVVGLHAMVKPSSCVRNATYCNFRMPCNILKHTDEINVAWGKMIYGDHNNLLFLGLTNILLHTQTHSSRSLCVWSERSAHNNHLHFTISALQRTLLW